MTMTSLTINPEEVKKMSIQPGHKAIVKIQPAGRFGVVGYQAGEEVILRTAGGEVGVVVDSRTN